MPDPDQSYNITIRTMADFSAAIKAQVELEQRLAQEKTREEYPHEDVIRLEALRSAISQFQNSPPGSAPAPQPAPFTLPDIVHALASGPFGFFRFLMHPRTLPNPTSPPPQKPVPPATSLTPSPDYKPRFTPSGELILPELAAPEPASQPHPRFVPVPFDKNNMRPDEQGRDIIRLEHPYQPLSFPTNPPPSAVTNTPPGEASNSDGFAQSAAAHSQSIQSSGERLRSALETNSRFTTALFDQMLDWIESQNRRLDDTNHKISHLEGQIKSLKNP